ncbi:hypothetical protein [Pyxidicoccus caerfyrddinensis]|uniref:hypothetical protein n=1 Tax=Pyxidicoccus caerfyrddinensis TaxID=2709663 RepID=UPI0013DC40C5|nr:hypothetical protein [Pyxidicoccus caerfyrddinensis]
MPRKLIRWVSASCFVLALSACGPAETQEQTPSTVDEVEQSIGSTPSCTSSTTVVGFIQSKTDWAAACGNCATVAGGGFGLPGTYYERCCQQPRSGDGPTTCGSWKLIKPVCSACSPL